VVSIGFFDSVRRMAASRLVGDLMKPSFWNLAPREQREKANHHACVIYSIAQMVKAYVGYPPL
jgi:hypothetical protein